MNVALIFCLVLLLGLEIASFYAKDYIQYIQDYKYPIIITVVAIFVITLSIACSCAIEMMKIEGGRAKYKFYAVAGLIFTVPEIFPLIGYLFIGKSIRRKTVNKVIKKLGPLPPAEKEAEVGQEFDDESKTYREPIYAISTKCKTLTAEEKEIDDLYRQGYNYLFGIGVAADEDTALLYLKQAVENNHLEACYLLGTMYANPNSNCYNLQLASHFLSYAYYSAENDEELKINIFKSLGDVWYLQWKEHNNGEHYKLALNFFKHCDESCQSRSF